MRTLSSSTTSTLLIASIGISTLLGCKPKDKPATPEPTAVLDEELAEAEAPPRVELRDDRIVIHEKIQFDLDKATIRPESDGLLREIAELILANPQLEQISIEGHTCNLGTPEYNLDLSERRAAAVRKRLVREGVESERLVSTGYGLTRPQVANDDEHQREVNRRVEFRVVSQTTLARKVEIDARGQEKVVEERKQTVRDEPAPAPNYGKRRKS